VQQQIAQTDTMCGQRPNGCSTTLFNLRDNCNDYFNCLDESERLRTQYTNQLAQLQAQRSAIATGTTTTIDPALQNRITQMETDNQQSFLAKNKWLFIIGGVLIVGGVTTFLILRNRK
jgi:hypothetical protein